ncbi:MAG TPA: hypothetical protein VLW84_01685 [Terriglobales bacterium]|nr:hypothetical protein [Terriglobales bacterium]
MARHRIVVSVENSPYFAWQSQLFYYSCVTRMHVQPLFLVHDTKRPWEPEFYELARFGATVKMVPNYIIGDCLCRNVAGALLEAADFCGDDEFIVLCDPDMLFVGAVNFPAVLAGNFYSYVNFHQPFVEAAAARLGLQRQLRRRKDPELCCGPPYVIPTRIARRLAEGWLRAVDAFPQRSFHETWTDIMYAFGLAALELRFKVQLIHRVDTNTFPGARLRHAIVHYCDTNDGWNKRDFLQRHQVAEVWQPAFQAEKGTVLEEIFRQIRQAKAFYQDPVFLPRTG